MSCAWEAACASCTRRGTFAHDDETKAIVVDPIGDAIDTIRIAVEACPTGALSLTCDDEED